MHTTLFKKLLIALIITLPSFAAAADTTPPVSPKAPAAPEVAPNSAPSPVTENKKPEATAARQTAKLGYVDIARIANESEQGKALKALLATKKDQLQSKIDVKKKQIEKMKTSLESRFAKMSPQERDANAKDFQKKGKELQNKFEEFQKFARKSEEELISLQEKESRLLYEEIEKAAVTNGSANGFSVIVIKKDMLYLGSSVDALDVTESLMKLMNEARKKK